MSTSRLSPAMALFPLRLFLGITFVYAGFKSSTIRASCTPAPPPTSAPSSKASPTARRAASSSRTFAIPHPGARGSRRRDHRDPDRAAGHRRALHSDRRGRRHVPELPPLPHRELEHDPILPRPRSGLHLRLAALRPRRLDRAAGPRQRCDASLRGDGPTNRRRDAESPEADPAMPMSTRRTLLVEFGGHRSRDCRHLGAFKGLATPPSRTLPPRAPPALPPRVQRSRRPPASRGAGAPALRATTHPAPGSPQGSLAAQSSSAPRTAFPAARLPPTATPSDGSPDILIRDSEAT